MSDPIIVVADGPLHRADSDTVVTDGYAAAQLVEGVMRVVVFDRVTSEVVARLDPAEITLGPGTETSLYRRTLSFSSGSGERWVADGAPVVATVWPGVELAPPPGDATYSGTLLGSQYGAAVVDGSGTTVWEHAGPVRFTAGPRGWWMVDQLTTDTTPVLRPGRSCAACGQS